MGTQIDKTAPQPRSRHQVAAHAAATNALRTSFRNAHLRTFVCCSALFIFVSDTLRNPGSARPGTAAGAGISTRRLLATQSFNGLVYWLAEKAIDPMPSPFVPSLAPRTPSPAPTPADLLCAVVCPSEHRARSTDPQDDAAGPARGNSARRIRANLCTLRPSARHCRLKHTVQLFGSTPCLEQQIGPRSPRVAQCSRFCGVATFDGALCACAWRLHVSPGRSAVAIYSDRASVFEGISSEGGLGGAPRGAWHGRAGDGRMLAWE